MFEKERRIISSTIVVDFDYRKFQKAILNYNRENRKKAFLQERTLELNEIMLGVIVSGKAIVKRVQASTNNFAACSRDDLETLKKDIGIWKDKRRSADKKIAQFPEVMELCPQYREYSELDESKKIMDSFRTGVGNYYTACEVIAKIDGIGALTEKNIDEAMSVVKTVEELKANVYKFIDDYHRSIVDEIKEMHTTFAARKRWINKANQFLGKHNERLSVEQVNRYLQYAANSKDDCDRLYYATLSARSEYEEVEFIYEEGEKYLIGIDDAVVEDLRKKLQYAMQSAKEYESLVSSASWKAKSLYDDRMQKLEKSAWFKDKARVLFSIAMIVIAVGIILVSIIELCISYSARGANLFTILFGIIVGILYGIYRVIMLLCGAPFWWGELYSGAILSPGIAIVIFCIFMVSIIVGYILITATRADAGFFCLTFFSLLGFIGFILYLDYNSITALIAKWVTGIGGFFGSVFGAIVGFVYGIIKIILLVIGGGYWAPSMYDGMILSAGMLNTLFYILAGLVIACLVIDMKSDKVFV